MRLRTVRGAVRFLLGAFEAGCFPGSWYHLAQVSMYKTAPALSLHRRLPAHDAAIVHAWGLECGSMLTAAPACLS